MSNKKGRKVVAPVTEVREGFEMVDGVMQMLPMGPNPGTEELPIVPAAEAITEPVIETEPTVTVTETATQVEAELNAPEPVATEAPVDQPTEPVVTEPALISAEGNVPEPEVTPAAPVDPITAKLEDLRKMAAGTGLEGMVEDIATYLQVYSEITSSAEDILANEKDPQVINLSLIKRSENLKAIGVRIREKISDTTKECHGTRGSIADRAVEARRVLFKGKAEAKETEPATK